ncbi:OsmC family protein [Herminiimonas fonticola]|uniref:Putative OsmC-like protein n=1 Tax=Herminiimonas fonticola TaxID=303380 RepID=A0A4V3BW67_9BURK|nr:OsmC family protein [Herminiimonas fonticola]RBA24734.1 putative redox protein regulator of disulfide bond formation [Herminiimonas fonticola]TDN93848.1 putative OsmC-like protein [Herminiimonas fonticola]
MAQTEIKVTKGAGKLQQIVSAGPHSLIADAPSAFGGDDAGFVPHDLLAAALGACTAVTLNMYAGRKEIPLEKVDVTVVAGEQDGVYVFNRTLHYHGNLSAEQKDSLNKIADKCPVHKALSGEIKIVTQAN